MPYFVKEIFYSLQGEGINVGRPAVFLRFAGCNLWSGREEDRATATCDFCDTDFRGTDGPNGGEYTIPELMEAIGRACAPNTAPRFIVLTGGEPTLQVDRALLWRLHEEGFDEVAIETNGTRKVLGEVDWITVSPKAGTEIVQDFGDELKLIYLQEGLDPEEFVGLRFNHFVLQPMDGPDREANTKAAVAYCLAHPRWRLSLQTQKYLGIS